MKKTLSLVIAALMIISSVFVLASCGGDSSSAGGGTGIVGKWKTEIDFSKMADAMGSAGLGGLDLSGKTFPLTLDLKDGGKFELTTDEDAVKSVMKELMTQLFKAQGIDDVEGYLAQANMTFDDLIKQSGTDFDSMKASGTYTFENNELKLVNSEGEEGSTIKVELNGNELKFIEISGTETTTIPDGVLPLVFKRG